METYLRKLLIKAVSATYVAVVLLVSTGPVAKENKQVKEVEVPYSVLLASPLSGKEGDPLPKDLRELALPFEDKQSCGQAVIVPNVTVKRIDVAGSESKPLDISAAAADGGGVLERIARLMGRTPDPAVKVDQVRRELEKRRILTEWLEAAGAKPTLREVAENQLFAEAKVRILFPATPDAALEKEMADTFKGEGPPVLAKTVAELRTQIAKSVCGVNDGDRTTSAAILYKYALTQLPLPCSKPPCFPPPQFECDDNLLILGELQYRSGEYGRALDLYRKAADQAEKAGKCCAKALMNQGVMNGLLGKPNLALEDLNKALHCAPTDHEVLYNMACYYSVHKQLDLAQEYLEKSFRNGFRDCEKLRSDRDIENLRNSNPNEFRRIIEDARLTCQMR